MPFSMPHEGSGVRTCAKLKTPSQPLIPLFSLFNMADSEDDVDVEDISETDHIGLRDVTIEEQSDKWYADRSRKCGA